MTTTEEIILFPIGITFGAALVVILVYIFGVAGNDAFVERHDGIKDLVSDMRYDCEARPGVISCEWDEEELDFVPESE